VTATWTFGWDALVAIGTLSLAAGTGWLAWTTRKVARADLESLRAQWRPMLLPYGEPTFTSDAETGSWTGLISVQNRGRGPALYVRATLDPANVSPDHWSLGAISPDEARELRFGALPMLDVRYQLLLDYRDLAGHSYSSALVIDFPASPTPEEPRFAEGRFYDVKLLEVPVTQLGDSVPQEGLRPVSPPTTRGFGERVKGALTGAKEGFRKTTS
jgi:hypothetical protein